jgi:hypothetical protein
MHKRLIMVTLAVLVAAVSPSLAKDMTGKFSLGFHNSDAPIGGRYWASNMVAIDAGVGFRSNEQIVDDEAKESTLSFWLEGGVPIKLYDADNAHFFVRPSAVLGLLDNRDYGVGSSDAKWTSLDLVLSLGGELFFGDHFSVEATHGFKLNVTAVPDEVKEDVGADGFTSFSTFGNNLTTIGFHFYF